MKLIFNKLQSVRSRYGHHMPSTTMLKQLSGVAGLQALQMGISAVIGFLVIRNLSKADYAVFNLLVTGGLTLLGLAGMAIMNLYIPFSNRVGPSSTDLPITTAIYRRLNIPMLIIGIIVGLAFWLISAYINDWLNISFIIAMFFAFVSSMFQYYYRYPESAFKISGTPLIPFKISISSEVVRLILIVGVITLILPYFKDYGATFLLMAVTITSFSSLYVINKLFPIPKIQASDVKEEHKELFWGLLRPLLFPTYFYLFSQLFRGWFIYLISGTSVIAEAAALGRLMMLFAMMDKAVELVIIPKFGAIKDQSKFLGRLALSFLAIFSVCLGLLISAWAFPEVWLWILGEKYENLGNALLWAVAAAGIERLSGLVLFAQLARGDSKNQWWVPLLATGVYIIYVFFAGLDTAEKATIGLFIAALANLLAQLSIFGWRLIKRKNVTVQ